MPAYFHVAQDASGTIPAHWHEHLEILYVYAGSMTAVIQAETYLLSVGDVLVINSGDIHMTQIREEKTGYVLVQISAKQLRNYFPEFHRLRFDTYISQAEAEASAPQRYLRELTAVYEEQTDGYPLLFAARLHELLYCLYRYHASWKMTEHLTSVHRDFLRITEVLEWIQGHYREPLSLKEAADSLGFSREYFCRIFKKYTGQTFLAYLNGTRAMRLYESLCTSSESITTLMALHGITNYKVFLRVFRELYGDTPQGIRTHLRMSDRINSVI